MSLSQWVGEIHSGKKPNLQTAQSIRKHIAQHFPINLDRPSNPKEENSSCEKRETPYDSRTILDDDILSLKHKVPKTVRYSLDLTSQDFRAFNSSGIQQKLDKCKKP